ncbi:hypothetical protein K2173_018107 [Erythroxylum novogranatense]|uniref:Amino acid transporter transmembrane domain-containing protein n=1 Tax=Erythroxylum novogranatense TaxID=1862640 RepID=A0AAV8U961_9ROSI|nr:hypothetical protein K2173_018107 [Erythroxylum novogranatense]
MVDLGAMDVVITEGVMFYLKNRPPLETFSGFLVFFYGLGVVVYAFEGIGMVLPLKSEAKHKAKFGKVLALCTTFIALLCGRFGVLSYFAFGDDTKDIITINLGVGILSALVMERRYYGSRYSLRLRWVAILGVSLIALLVPNFVDFLALVGNSGWRGFILDNVIIAFGFTVAVSGAWISLLEILAAKYS